MWKPVEKDGQINERKWELKHKGVVLATIFYKPTGKFSLWISTPVVFNETKQKVQVIGQTYLYDSLDDARDGFRVLLKDKVSNWAWAVTDYLVNEV